MPKHSIGSLFGLVSRFDQLHAVLIRVLDKRPFAASTGVNLRFDDGDRSAKFLKRGGGRLSGSGDPILENFDAELVE